MGALDTELAPLPPPPQLLPLSFAARESPLPLALGSCVEQLLRCELCWSAPPGIRCLQVFDVASFDMIAMLRLPFVPGCIEWCFQVG